MSDPVADFPDDRAQWLIQALSLTTSQAALEHLCKGWREFTPAQAVLVCRRSRADVAAVFLRKGDSPRTHRDLKIPVGSEEEILRQIEPVLPVDDFTFQSPVNLHENGRLVGWVGLWTAGEQIDGESSWLREASARILANFANLEDRLFQEKMEALGEFAAGAGHEINNPVATISGRVQGLLRNETNAERRRQLVTIGGQALRIRDMIGDAMLFARPPEPGPEPIELSQVLPEILRPLEENVEKAGADFVCDLAEGACLFADRTQLAVVITELLRNSLEWIGEKGKIQLIAKTVDTPPGPMAEIVIEDNGESFPEEHIPHLFDPFFSGRQAGRGLGFGLPKCWRIVSNHHGSIDIASLPEEGTRVTVIWPAYDFRSTSS